jgi:hypothetical protein
MTPARQDAVQSTLAAIALCAVAFFPLVARVAGWAPEGLTAAPTVGGSAAEAPATSSAQLSSAAFCGFICREIDRCFAPKDAGQGKGAASASVARCTGQCAQELGICGAAALSEGRRCLEKPTRDCNRAGIDECFEDMTIDCAGHAMRDGGR